MKQFGIMVGLDKKDAFEGWFCKVDDPKNGLLLSIIWGYSTHRETKHAFIQFQDSLKHDTTYISYPIEELNWKEDPFVLQIGNNELSQSGMILDFEMDGIFLRGDFQFSSLSPIKKSFLKPNIMGWLTYFPNECNHSIISMNHKVSGELMIGNQSWTIEDADGYIEKDWGTSFPKEYVWVQANDWDNSSVVFSYATVPVFGKYAKGFFLVLHHEGKEYRFSSIEGSKLMNFKVSDDSFSATIKKKHTRLKINAKQTNAVELASPDNGEMKSHIKESLDGTLELILEIEGRNFVELSSKRASIDVHYNL
ncbi:tocopherol cyclase family protein [Gudongella sp. DL1XJH-153]|uniref:tocopherol cyclase family protein n=1 Tax=Gudongella sp. DL1XJH-153 TaxID=3409804 RepID=UPI003BB51776